MKRGIVSLDQIEVNNKSHESVNLEPSKYSTDMSVFPWETTNIGGWNELLVDYIVCSV